MLIAHSFRLLDIAVEQSLLFPASPKMCHTDRILTVWWARKDAKKACVRWKLTTKVWRAPSPIWAFSASRRKASKRPLNSGKRFESILSTVCETEIEPFSRLINFFCNPHFRSWFFSSQSTASDRLECCSPVFSSLPWRSAARKIHFPAKAHCIRPYFWQKWALTVKLIWISF